jgi:predicted amino acid dehydrogenase
VGAAAGADVVGLGAERWIVGCAAGAAGVDGLPATGSALTTGAGCCGELVVPGVPGVARMMGTLGAGEAARCTWIG